MKIFPSSYTNTHTNLYSYTNIQLYTVMHVIYNVQTQAHIFDCSFQIDFFLTQHWVDRRLQFQNILARNTYVSLPDRFITKLWVPDLFLTRAKQGRVHSITDQSRVLKLNPYNGNLLLSQRYTMHAFYFNSLK